MTGPFLTARGACESVPACVSVHFFAPEDPPPTDPRRACSWTDSLEDRTEGLDDRQPGFRVHLAEFDCEVPSLLPRGVSAGSTHALVKRTDGWWIGPAWFQHDDTRDCWDELRPSKWTRHDVLDVLSASLTRVCKYAGSERDRDLEIVIDPTTKTPLAFSPVELGTRMRCIYESECTLEPAVEVPSHWEGGVLTVGTQQYRFR